LKKAHSISISEAAEVDIRNAFLWYEEQKMNLGISFENSISKTIQQIQKNPLKVQIRYNTIRVAFLSKFPYGIHYTVRENDILIIAGFHTSENPVKWLGR